MAKEALPKPTERTAYALERRPGNNWVTLTMTVRGETVVKVAESEPDTFAAQVGRVGHALKRLV